MRRATAAMGLLVLWGMVGPGAPAAEASQLALPILTGAQKPELTLAQRVISNSFSVNWPIRCVARLDAFGYSDAVGSRCSVGTLWPGRG